MGKKLVESYNKPSDYALVTTVDVNGGEKQRDHFVVKMWWSKVTNKKETYVYNGQQLYDTYFKQGKRFESVLQAMVFKFNENITNCKKIEIYDNSVYGKIKKIATFNGVETIIHKHIDNELLSTINGLHIKYKRDKKIP